MALAATRNDEHHGDRTTPERSAMRNHHAHCDVSRRSLVPLSMYTGVGTGARVPAVCCALALLAASCSSGGGKQSVPTTPRPGINATVSLGPCPNPDPRNDLAKTNKGVAGLDKTMVPITAVRVRMCRYGGGLHGTDLVGERTMVRPSNAARFAAEANAFPAAPTTTLAPGSRGFIGGGDCPQGWYHVVTFASASQRVEIREGCGWVTNGVLEGSGAHWFSELANYTR